MKVSTRWPAFFASVGFALGLALSSCGPTAANCIPSNCAGCCSVDGECLKGTTVKACGRSGEACSDCGSAGTCEVQQCITYGPWDGGEEGGGVGADGGGAGGGSAGGSAMGGGAAGGGSTGGGSAGGGSTGGGVATGGGSAGGSAGGAAGGSAGGAAGGSAGGAAGGSAGGAGGGTPIVGLLGQYFTTKEPFQTMPITRSDANIDFDWGAGSPIAGAPTDGFSVRWTGQVQPQFSQTYTFYTLADDGTRLWVDGQPVVDNWRNGAAAEHNGTITLVAGTKYDLRLEYYDNNSGASVKLSWSSTSQPKQIVPATRLFPPVATTGYLWGDYYVDDQLSLYYGHRNDGPINFDWTADGPSASFPYTTYYSVRWTGTLLPPTTGLYTLYTLSDDGVRLWVDGVPLVNNWTTHGAVEDSATMSFTAGQRVNIRLDYNQITGEAVVGLAWTPAGQAKQVVPASALAP